MDAAAKTLMVFGVIHLLILVVYASLDTVEVLNAFSILNLNRVIPALGEGAVSFVVSYTVVLAVYGLVFLRLTHQKP
jgi:hypothetical protein